MEITAKIARFVAETQFEKIPSKAIETAKVAVRDCLGVALAGSKEEDAKICAEIARAEGAKEEASVIGQGFKIIGAASGVRQRHRGPCYGF